MHLDFCHLHGWPRAALPLPFCWQCLVLLFSQSAFSYFPPVSASAKQNPISVGGLLTLSQIWRWKTEWNVLLIIWTYTPNAHCTPTVGLLSPIGALVRALAPAESGSGRCLCCDVSDGGSYLPARKESVAVHPLHPTKGDNICILVSYINQP